MAKRGTGIVSEEFRLQQTKDNKDKVRVFALARSLGVDSKTIIDICKGMGFDVKSQLASLEPEQVDALKARLGRGGKAVAAPEPPKPVNAPIPQKERKIVNLAKAKSDVRPENETRPPEAPVANEPPQFDEPVAEVVEPIEVPVVEERPIEAVATPPEPVVEVKVPEPVAVVAEPAPPPIKAHVSPVEPPPIKVPAEAPPPIKTPVAEAPKPAVVPPIAPPIAPPPIQRAATPTPATAAPAIRSPQQRMLNLNQRSRQSDTRPVSAPPRQPAAPTQTQQSPPPIRTAAPPIQGGGRPGVAPPIQRAPGGGPGGPGNAGGPNRPPLDRNRRPDGRPPLGQAQAPRPGTPPVGDKKPGTAGPLKFTAEQLQALREGRSVTDVLKKTPPPGPAGPAVPGKPDEGEETDEDGKKKHGPGKIVGRDVRHADRAKRQEQRKVRQKDVVIQGGQVDISEEEFGSKRGRRAAMLKKRMRLPGTVERKGKVPITLPITVRSLSEAIGMKVAELVFKLKDLTSTLFTINSNIDTDTAELIATEKGVEFEIIKQKSAEDDLFEEHKQAVGDESKLEPRAPVVTIMGHVDHGKTSLLDRIRKSNVVDTEAGGITQVIRAWRVIHNGKPITFLDTPGHEAFTKMRARGANVTDIAVIVVAANDGVMPQTEEAIAHAKAAGVSIVVAINKVDLPDANLKRTEQQLYGFGLIPDTMGGDCQFVQTSATKGLGIGDLLDTLSLVAEVKELKANSHKPAMGTCLEAHLSGNEGVMATFLIQQGTLHKGDIIICGSSYGRVRAMYDDLGRPLETAGPTMPVVITGLDDVPNADDHFHVVTELAKAGEIAEKRKVRAKEALFKPREAINLEKLGEAKIKIAELKVVLKAEARGSVEAIRKELEKLVHDEVRVRVLHAGIGAITESDVQLALASPEDTIVVGFNVVPDDMALHLAEERSIKIREYQIIYKLTEDIKAALEGKLKPREEVIHLGRAIIRELFKVSRVGTIAGCYVTQGTIERMAKVRVIREGAVVYPPPEKVASLESLKRHKDDAKEVREGFECGMKVAGYDDIKVGDVIEAYRIEQVQRTLLDR